MAEPSLGAHQTLPTCDLLWHGNVDEALDRIDNLLMDLDLISRQSAPAEKLAAGISDLRTYMESARKPGVSTRSV